MKRGDNMLRLLLFFLEIMVWPMAFWFMIQLVGVARSWLEEGFDRLKPKDKRKGEDDEFLSIEELLKK